MSCYDFINMKRQSTYTHRQFLCNLSHLENQLLTPEHFLWFYIKQSMRLFRYCCQSFIQLFEAILQNHFHRRMNALNSFSVNVDCNYKALQSQHSRTPLLPNWLMCLQLLIEQLSKHFSYHQGQWYLFDFVETKKKM